MQTTVKHLVKGTTANFSCYRDGELWYSVEYAFENETRKFEFPVPVTDTGTGIFPVTMKAITLMRWIRKHYEKHASGEWRA
ncbi:MAG: hypothetical protein KIT34_01345 [Cyanobacteria bacterium TGS_CYA1]|nr:hypothetical protein [Cyanobacteria bacterium TGS_CYA1]